MANFRFPQKATWFSVGYQKYIRQIPTFHLAATIRQLMEMVNATTTTMVNKPRSMASGGV